MMTVVGIVDGMQRIIGMSVVGVGVVVVVEVEGMALDRPNENHAVFLHKEGEH